MFSIKTPLISVIIGEGGSGGALALAVGDRVIMMEHSVYSVISPEGCAAILWNKNDGPVGQKEYENASEALKLTSKDLLDLGVIDKIIPEPLGGAHRNRKVTAQSLGAVLKQLLDELAGKPYEELLDERYRKFRVIGELKAER
jgi:acetyl-CoA carboxylase carboxyl transferase subunit alpha